MRRLTTWSGACAAALMLLPATTVAGARRTHAPRICRPFHSRLLAADAQAQIYEAYESRDLFVSVFGCVFGHRHSYELGGVDKCTGGPGACGGVVQPTLAGRLVAYGASLAFGEGGGGEWWIVVRNLATGRILHTLPTGFPQFGLNRGIGNAQAIVLKSTGSVAWITGAGVSLGRYQVYAFDTGGQRRLATGPDIDPKSLALAGSTLYWTQAGKPMSAPLH